MTRKQKRFVEEYLIDLNATQAAIRAGYSPKTAVKIGHQILDKTRHLVDAALAARSVRTGVSADRVVRELARVAFADPRAVFEWGPGGVRPRASSELSEDDAAIIAAVEETTSETGGSIKIKLCDKLKALEMLSRHLGMFKDKLEVDMNITPASILEDLRGRRAEGTD
jgi:phage terminase small subunit